MTTAPVAVVRPPDWPARLTAFVASRRHRPFEWGCNDCLCLVADWLVALGAADPMAPWRGRYHDGGDADLCLAAHTPSGDVFEALDLWLPSLAPRFARRGDVAGIHLPTPTGPAPLLGLVTGARVAVPTMTGLAFVPLHRAVRVWSIG
ncbi:MAG: hypothetical protein GC191_08205 [Azospirillum sp.]|nr:hypothetical protein [Azospirillum sp.]